MTTSHAPSAITPTLSVHLQHRATGVVHAGTSHTDARGTSLFVSCNGRGPARRHRVTTAPVTCLACARTLEGRADRAALEAERTDASRAGVIDPFRALGLVAGESLYLALGSTGAGYLDVTRRALEAGPGDEVRMYPSEARAIAAYLRETLDVYPSRRRRTVRDLADRLDVLGATS
jgi:hypothetical protein